jgi:transcription antitermination factor NusG
LVYDQLVMEGFQTFLPEIEVWVRQNGARRTVKVPMFNGYLFMRAAMDKNTYIAASRTRGLVRVLGERWDRLAVVPDSEIDAIAKLTTANMNPRPHPYLREGRRVRITKGPLTGVEGLLVQVTPEKGLLVVSIELFRRSVSVEVDCTLAGPA